MASAGIDVSHYKAHSTRAASTSAAARVGVSTAQILLTADGSSANTFSKFYKWWCPMFWGIWLDSPVFGSALKYTRWVSTTRTIYNPQLCKGTYLPYNWNYMRTRRRDSPPSLGASVLFSLPPIVQASARTYTFNLQRDMIQWVCVGFIPYTLWLIAFLWMKESSIFFKGWSNCST